MSRSRFSCIRFSRVMNSCMCVRVVKMKVNVDLYSAFS